MRQVFPVSTVFDSKKQKWQKHPSVPRGVSWRDYKASEAQMSRAVNVGAVVPTGRVVIDLDSYKGVSREAVEEALGVALDWDAALLQRTVSGGEHYAFDIPSGVTIRQGENLLGASGFDTRTAGKGWICTGEGYEDCTLFGMPDALYDEDRPELPLEAVILLSANADGQGARHGDDGGMGDLESAVASQALDGVTLEDAEAYVARLPDEDLEHYSDWLKVGMALHHQFDGSDDAKALWVKWSERSADFDKAEIDAKWPGFGDRDGVATPTRFDYIIDRAGGKWALRTTLVENLLDKAGCVRGHADYEAFKREVLKTPAVDLPIDARQMVGKALYDAFGKDAGISRSAINKSITPSRKRLSGGEAKRRDGSGLFKDWVYVEKTCEFATTALNYSIKREAFRAKFDRLPDVVEAERNAADYALIDDAIPTVVDKMFWPGADRIFSYEGMEMLNDYVPPSLEVQDVLDNEGEKTIEVFLKHLDMTIADKREQTILLDWMTYVIQNPGQRVNWALLLQGAQGTGKTYFATVLSGILQHLVTSLEPAAIAGRFTGWAHGSQAVVVEEVRISGANKYEVLDRLKPYITNDTIQIEEKGRDHRTVPNFSSYFMLTNHKDAVPLGAGDRRYCVIFGRLQTEGQLFKYLGGAEAAGEYFDRLFDLTKRRPDALAKFFYERDVSDGFSPRGRAPHTSAKDAMVHVSVSPEREMVESAIFGCQCDVINDRVVDVTYLNEMAQLEGLELPKTRAMSAILLEMGYIKSSRRVKIAKTQRLHYVWHREDEDEDAARDQVKGFHDDPDFVPF